MIYSELDYNIYSFNITCWLDLWLKHWPENKMQHVRFKCKEIAFSSQLVHIYLSSHMSWLNLNAFIMHWTKALRQYYMNI